MNNYVIHAHCPVVVVLSQADPAFLAANDGERPDALRAAVTTEDEAGEGGLNLMKDMDPLAVLALVQEYVVSRSPQLSTRQYLDTQRVAHRVWSQHFRHKRDMRGKVSDMMWYLA